MRRDKLGEGQCASSFLSTESQAKIEPHRNFKSEFFFYIVKLRRSQKPVDKSVVSANLCWLHLNHHLADHSYRKGPAFLAGLGRVSASLWRQVVITRLPLARSESHLTVVPKDVNCHCPSSFKSQVLTKTHTGINSLIMNTADHSTSLNIFLTEF